MPLPANKYLLTGATPLQTGGSNSVSISKANLPNIQLQVNSFSLTRGTMDITGVTTFGVNSREVSILVPTGAFYWDKTRKLHFHPGGSESELGQLNFQASKNWTGNTSSASPYTQALGNGTALNIQPAYITLKFWKRLT